MDLLYLHNARDTFFGNRKSEKEKNADKSKTSRRQDFNFCNILLYAYLGMQQQISVGFLSCYDSSRCRRSVALCEHIQKVHKATPHKLNCTILPKIKKVPTFAELFRQAVIYKLKFPFGLIAVKYLRLSCKRQSPSLLREENCYEQKIGFHDIVNGK